MAKFSGEYSDPNHPDCPREIYSETRGTALVIGSDSALGDGYACDGTTDVSWGPLSAIIDGDDITVDFSPKGGPSDLGGEKSSDDIIWDDGNLKL